jgi:isopenicillin N synthase-like dioxygenase
MSSELELLSLPPGTQVAELETIHLGQLAAGDAEEAVKLFRACKKHGVFYLDLRQQQHLDHDDTFVKSGTINDVYALSEALFDLDVEEKMAYDIDKLSEMKINGCVYISEAIKPFEFQSASLLIQYVCSYKPLGRNLGGNDYSKIGEYRPC